jgi:hypothetical protein
MYWKLGQKNMATIFRSRDRIDDCNTEAVVRDSSTAGGTFFNAYKIRMYNGLSRRIYTSQQHLLRQINRVINPNSQIVHYSFREQQILGVQGNI